jgi:hypothetical protein
VSGAACLLCDLAAALADREHEINDMTEGAAYSLLYAEVVADRDSVGPHAATTPTAGIELLLREFGGELVEEDDS